MVVEQQRRPAGAAGVEGGADGFPRPFGPYLLLCSFARGGMGEVFLAKTGGIAGIDKLCVLKTLRPELIEDDEYVGRFIDEARVVVQLSHVNIAQVFDVGRVGKEHYLAMEYVAGVNVRELAERARDASRALTLDLALYVGTEILEGLDYAHRRTHDETGELLRLVHRDVSPQNAMVSYEGEVKLIDFGLARSSLKLEHSDNGVVMGKVAYMAPEQARGDEVDARADQYAAAIVLYELVAGERFYGGMKTRDLWNVVGDGAFRPAGYDRLDQDLRAILDRALHAEPQRRYASCGELRDALLTFAAKLSATGSRRSLRELLKQLFDDEIGKSRTLVARFAKLSAADVRAATEATATHRIALVDDAERDGGDGTPATATKPRALAAPRPSGKRYQETGLLAEGGMALVLLGEDEQGGPVVVKRVRPPYCFDQAYLRLFQDEGAVHAALRDDHIVELLDCGEDDQGPYLVFEHIDGTDLGVVLEAAHAERRPLDVEATLAIGVPLLQALAAAHDAALPDGTKIGIVHRDVSPGNVLLSVAGEVKLADFGVASFALKSERTVAGELKGKFAYMAPEQTRGEAVTARTDLFAAGVLLFECLAGKKLFDGPTDADVVQAVRTAGAPSLLDENPAVPAPLAALVAELLAKDPAARPADAGAVVKRLQAIAVDIGLDEGMARHVARLARSAPRREAGQVPVPARRRTHKVPAKDVEGGLVVTAAPARRRPLGWIAAASVALLALGGGALWWSVAPGPAPPARPIPIVEQLPPTPLSLNDLDAAKTGAGAVAGPIPLGAAPGPNLRSGAPAPSVVAAPAPAAKKGAGAASAKRKVSMTGVGAVSISATPWAQVEIDGVLVKDQTPLLNHPVKAGVHKVVLRNPKFGTKELLIEVNDGAHVKRSVDLLE